MSERFRDYKYIGRERKESREDILGKKKKKKKRRFSFEEAFEVTPESAKKKVSRGCLKCRPG